LAEVPYVGTATAPVALVFDYDSAYAWESQPQGADFDYFQLVFDCYRALRRAGLSVDVVPKSVDPSAYKITFAPGLLTLPESLRGGLVVAGPRAGSKTEELTIPEGSWPRYYRPFHKGHLRGKPSTFCTNGPGRGWGIYKVA
jgi:beta-galactosidase